MNRAPCGAFVRLECVWSDVKEEECGLCGLSLKVSC